MHAVLKGFAALAVSVLAACGGGGGDDTETLYVQFDYDNVDTSVRQAISLPPQIAGLGSRTPSCTLLSGVLPPGVTLASNCSISGSTTAVGNFGFTVRLTSRGVEGFVDASGLITVDDPTPTLAANPGNFGGQAGFWRLTLGGALDLGPLVQRGGPEPRSGDELRYSLSSGALPEGLQLDPNDATVDGTAEAYGSATADIVFTVRRNGVDYASPAVTVTIDVMEPALGLSYADCNAIWALPVSCLPTTTAAPIAGSSIVFSAPGVPLGFAVDSLSGELYGTPATLLQEGVTVTAVWTLPDGDTQVVSVNVNLNTTGPAPLYLPSTDDIGVASGPDSSPDGLGGNVVGLVAGQAFEMPVDFVVNTRDGDVYSYTLVQSDPAFPLPDWVSVDAQGTLRGTPPVQAVGVPQYWTLRFLAQRAGQSRTVDRLWSATVQ